MATLLLLESSNICRYDAKTVKDRCLLVQVVVAASAATNSFFRWLFHATVNLMSSEQTPVVRDRTLQRFSRQALRRRPLAGDDLTNSPMKMEAENSLEDE